MVNRSGEENLDLLRNLEFGIVGAYRARPTLLDAGAQNAVAAFARHSHAEEEGRTPPARNLSEPAGLISARLNSQPSGGWEEALCRERRISSTFRSPLPISSAH